MNVRVDSDILATDALTGAKTLKHNPAQFRSFLLATSACMALLLASTACFNYLVDPYLRFGSPRLAGINAVKPAAIKQVKMAKAYQVCQGEYRTILLGNSRVDVGLDPESEVFPVEYRPVYNLGQPGTGSEGALVYLEHVLAHCPPSHVIVGVDFMSFLENPHKDAAPAEPASLSPELLRLAPIEDSRPSLSRTRQRLQDALAADLSLSALSDSVRTLAAQRDPHSANITERGFNTAQAFHSLIRVEGQASLFEQKNQEYEAKLLKQRAPEFESSREIRAINAIIELCDRYGVEPKFFIHPYHADVLHIFERTGHWDEFESWKQQLVRLCDNRRVELWDFSAYSSVTTEPVPVPGDRKTVMNGYWESGHYRATTGDLLLAQIFGTPRISNFGARLSRN